VPGPFTQVQRSVLTRSFGNVSCGGRQNADLGDTLAVGGAVARGGDDQVWDSLRSAQNLQARRGVPRLMDVVMTHPEAATVPGYRASD
jgi:hypothetical protein